MTPRDDDGTTLAHGHGQMMEQIVAFGWPSHVTEYVANVLIVRGAAKVTPRMGAMGLRIRG